MNITDLPDEILYHVFGQFAIWDLIPASQVNSTFANIARANSVWQQVYCHSFHPPASKDVLQLLNATQWHWREIVKDRLVFEREILDVGGPSDPSLVPVLPPSKSPFATADPTTVIPPGFIKSWNYFSRPPKERSLFLRQRIRLIALCSHLDNYRPLKAYLALPKLKMCPWWAAPVRSDLAPTVVVRFAFFLTVYESIEIVPDPVNKGELACRLGNLRGLDFVLSAVTSLMNWVASSQEIAHQSRLSAEVLEVSSRILFSLYQTYRDASFLNNYAGLAMLQLSVSKDLKNRNQLFELSKELLRGLQGIPVVYKLYNMSCAYSAMGLHGQAKKYLRASFKPEKSPLAAKKPAEDSDTDSDDESYWPEDLAGEDRPVDGWEWFSIADTWPTALSDTTLKPLRQYRWWKRLLLKSYKGKRSVEAVKALIEASLVEPVENPDAVGVEVDEDGADQIEGLDDALQALRSFLHSRFPTFDYTD